MKKVANEEQIDELAERVEKLEQAVFEKERDIRDQKKKKSLTEFIQGCNIPHHVQKAVAIAYFLENYEGRGAYTTADIDSGYGRAKLQRPSNIHDVMRRAAEKGHFMEADEGDSTTHWELTQTGIDYVEEDLISDDDK